MVFVGISSSYAETSSTVAKTQTEAFAESRLRIAAGITAAINTSGDFSRFNGIGAGWNASAAYELGANSPFWVGLTGGSLTGGYFFSRAPYDIAFVQPFVMFRTISGDVHPLIKVAVGPGFRGTEALFTATWAMGVDIDIAGPVSISLEPINITFLTPGNQLSWAPQLNLVATF